MHEGKIHDQSQAVGEVCGRSMWTESGAGSSSEAERAVVAGPGEGTLSALARALERAALHQDGVTLSRAGTSTQTPGTAFGTDEAPQCPHVPPVAMWPLLGPLTLHGWGRALRSPALRSLPPEACMTLGTVLPPRCRLMSRAGAWAAGSGEGRCVGSRNSGWSSQRVWGDPRPPQVALSSAPATWSPGREEPALADCSSLTLSQDEPVTTPRGDSPDNPVSQH